MTEDELIEVKKYRPSIEPCIHIDQLKNQKDRTLLYGYTCDRCDWHLYLKDGEFHLNIHEWDEKDRCYGKEIPINHCTPDKRVYPAACDFEFCMLLDNVGHHIPFTTFTHRVKEDFYGDIV